MAEELWITPRRDVRTFERGGSLLILGGSYVPRGTTIVASSMKVLTYDHKEKMCLGFRKADSDRVWLIVEELILTVDEFQKLEALWDKTCKEKNLSISPFEAVFFAQLQLSSGAPLQ